MTGPIARSNSMPNISSCNSVTALQQTGVTANKRIVELEATNVEQQKTIELLNNELFNLRGEYRDKCHELVDKDISLVQTHYQLIDVHKDLEKEEAYNRDMRYELRGARIDYRSSQTELADVRNELASKNDALVSKAAELADKDKAIEALNASRDKAVEKSISMSHDLYQKNQRIVILQQEKRSLERDLTNVNALNTRYEVLAQELMAGESVGPYTGGTHNRMV